VHTRLPRTCLVGGDFEAQGSKLGCVLGARLAAVVGDEQQALAGVPEGMQGLHCVGNQLLAAPQHTVLIKYEVVQPA
jgi:hypothetical protein